MKKIHENLSSKLPWYSDWHNHSKANLLHWTLFILIGILTTTNLVYLLNKSEPTLALAAILPNNLPAPLELAYGTDPNQKLDLYKDNTLPAQPVALIIHGGSWQGGDKRGVSPSLDYQMRLLYKKGFALISMNYRLAPQYPFPAAMEDVNTVLGLIVANGASFGLLSDQIIVNGESAGANLGALVAVTDSRVKGFISTGLPSKLDDFADNSFTGIAAGIYFGSGCKISTCLSIAKQASPYYQATRTLPMLLINGENDSIVPPSQSYLMANKNGNSNTTVVVVPGAGHVGNEFNIPMVENAITSFINKTATLTFTVTGPGKVITEWGTFGPGTHVGTVPTGTSVTINAYPDAGAVFSNWISICSTANGNVSVVSGTNRCTLTLNGNVSAGVVFSNNNYATPYATPYPTPPPTPQLVASPSSVPVGGTVTVTFTGVPGPTPLDWIGMYVLGDDNANYVGAGTGSSAKWFYDSNSPNCTKGYGTATSNGSCSFTMPSTPGYYNFKLWANNGLGTPHAVSNTVTVTSNNTPPVVATPLHSSVTTTSATLGANITSLGVPTDITAYGTCYTTSPSMNPITTNCLSMGSTNSTGAFSHSRTGLTPNTTYYYQGYATNSTGTGRSSINSFIKITPSYVTPVIAPPNATLTFTVTGPGRVITAWGTFGPGTHVGTVPIGTNVTIDAYPDARGMFSSWVPVCSTAYGNISVVNGINRCEGPLTSDVSAGVVFSNTPSPSPSYQTPSYVTPYPTPYTYPTPTASYATPNYIPPTQNTTSTFTKPVNLTNKTEVINLQTILNKELGLNLAVDGIYGKMSLSAVKSFQSAHSLTPDGIIGPLTRAKLNEVASE